ncbi:MAG TPA: lysyl oxidase family protein [Actinomycetota bacterium]
MRRARIANPRVAALTIATLLLTLVPVAAANAAPGDLRLRLLAASDVVELWSYGREGVYLDLGTHLAAEGASLDIRVRRDPLGPDVHAVWASPGGDVPIPDELLHRWNGLRRFFWIDVYQRGEHLRHRAATFCPNAYDVQRFDDSGPMDPTFPDACGYHPFTLGMPWGVDQGWAVSATAFADNLTMRLAKGWYRFEIAIRPAFRRLFGIDRADARASVLGRVHGGFGCGDCPFRRDRGTPGRAPAAVPDDTTPDPGTIPDLAALPAYAIGVESRGEHDLLTFASNVWNAGPAALLVEGFRQPGAELMDAYQYFSLDGEVVSRAPVGTFEFEVHADHSHWHFQQFARYRLLDESQALVMRSRKAAFCLAPTDPIDLLVPGAARRLDELGFSQCGGPEAMWIRETLPVGWGDTYYQGIFGQAFTITDVPNGTYYIEVAANPQGLLYDGDPSNDVALREVILGGEPGSRTVVVPPWNGIDTG